MPKEIGVLGLLRGLVYALLLFLLAGKFFTGSFVWGYDGKWVHLKTYTPNVSTLYWRWSDWMRLSLSSSLV